MSVEYLARLMDDTMPKPTVSKLHKRREKTESELAEEPKPVQCENQGCSNTFIPNKFGKKKRACSQQCYWQLWASENPRIKLK